MKVLRWLTALAALLLVLAVVVFGWMGISLFQQRQEVWADALARQTLKVAQAAEAGRILSDLIAGELRQGLAEVPGFRNGGRGVLTSTTTGYEYVYENSRPESARLSGSLYGTGAAGSDRGFGRFQRLLQFLYDRNAVLAGQPWSSRLKRIVFVAADGVHALSVPSSDLSDLPASVLAAPSSLPGVGNGRSFSEAWVNSAGDPVQTALVPILDAGGAWLGNVVIDFDLRELDQLLAEGELPQVQWFLVTKNNRVLARSVDAGGPFGGLAWGNALARRETPGWAVNVAAVPGSNLTLESAVPESWLYQDVILVAQLGGVILVVMLVAFALLGRHLVQRERETYREIRAVEARVEGDRRQREVEVRLKDELSAVSTELHRATTAEEFARVVLSACTRLLGAQYGAVYQFDGSRFLEPVGTLGVTADSLSRVAMGEGLLGECAKSKTRVRVSGVQAGVRLVWGQGELTPQTVELLPLEQSGGLLGVLVLGYLNEDSERPAFHDAFVPMVSFNLEILNRNAATADQARSLERQQAILRETEAWSRSIIESSPDGMLVVDNSGTIVMANTPVEQLLGYGLGELIGQGIEALVPDTVRHRHGKMRQSFTEGAASKALMGIGARTVQAARKDGTTFDVEIGLTKLPPLADSGDCVCAWVRAK